MREREELITEYLRKLVQEGVGGLRELIEVDSFQPGDHYGAEQMLSDPDLWDFLTEEERREFLRALGEHLGIDLLHYLPDQAIREYQESGVAGQPSEGGADVQVLPTKFPELEVHVMKYKNPTLGTRYDLVRSS